MNETRLNQIDFLKVCLFIVLAVFVWNLQNLGNNLTPRNFMAWFGIILIATVLLVDGFYREKISFSKSFGLLFIPPAAILIHGFIFPPGETVSYYMWLAFGATLFFAIFIVALMQVSDTEKIWPKFADGFLLVFLVLGLITYIAPKFSFGNYLYGLLPLELAAKEAGFQQINQMASFGAALVLWSISLRIKFNDESLKSWLFISFVAFSISVMIFITGSRTGILGLLIGSFLVLVTGLYKKNSRFYLAPIIAVATAFIIVSGISILTDGGSRAVAVNSIVSLTSGNDINVAARLNIYHVAFLSGLENILFGHGLGSFSESYYQTYLSNVPSHKDWFHYNNLIHPHNEILIHWVEMGLWGILLVVFPLIVFLIKSLVSYTKYPFLLLGVLFPILLHSQTEMVAHASGFHWMLVGFAIASLTSRNFEAVKLNKFYFVAPLVVGVIGSYFAVTSAYAGKVAWETKVYAGWAKNIGVHLKRLSEGQELQHWALGTEANDRLIKTMMSVALNKQDTSLAKAFLPRLIDQNKRWQQKDSWAMVAQVYLMLGEMDNYKKHMEEVRLFDSNYADFLEKAFDVKLDKIN